MPEDPTQRVIPKTEALWDISDWELGYRAAWYWNTTWQEGLRQALWEWRHDSKPAS